MRLTTQRYYTLERQTTKHNIKMKIMPLLKDKQKDSLKFYTKNGRIVALKRVGINLIYTQVLIQMKIIHK